MNDESQNPKSDVVSTSPVPKRKVEMLSFADALREVLNGKKMTRVAWDDTDVFIYLEGEFLSINMNGKIHQLIVSVGDMEGIDWYALPVIN